MKFFKYVDLSKIKVLSFDLDNTIYDCQSVLTKAEDFFTSYLCQKYGLGGECSSYTFWAKIKSNLLKERPELENDVTMLRAVSLVEAFNLLKLPLKGGLEEAMDLVALFVKHRSAGFVAPQIFDMLYALKSKYSLVAVSNGNLDAIQLGVFDYFETDIRPNMDNLRCKPHEDMFLECVRFKNVRKDEILHIGDDPYTDVYGAAAVNIPCLWLYKGYTGISPDEHKIRLLPNIMINNILELKTLLLNN